MYTGPISVGTTKTTILVDSSMPRQPTCDRGECAKCKHRIYMRTWYQEKTPEERRAWVNKRDRQKTRETDRRRYERDKPKRLMAMAEYQDDPVKRAARVAVGNAVRDGRLVKGHCVELGPACQGRIEAHHKDYAKPLEVEWRCSAHHGIVHQR
jgi:hypothetical protein